MSTVRGNLPGQCLALSQQSGHALTEVLVQTSKNALAAFQNALCRRIMSRRRG